MSAAPRAAAWRRRADFRAASGVLLVLRAPPPAPPPVPGQPAAVAADPSEGDEILLALADDGWLVGLAGHVDLGTGLATALAQLLSEELDQPFERTRMLMGDTGRAPNQGPTIASASIQIHAEPLRRAAAQARRWLLEAAAARWEVTSEGLRTAEGAIHAEDGRRLDYAELVAGAHVELRLDPQAPLKTVDEHRTVGRSLPRVDLPAKVTGGTLDGQPMWVHDLRLPGMLHGRVLRPPYAGMDAGDFVGRSLRRVDEASVAGMPGFVALVVLGDFIGLVCEREEQAEVALRALVVEWAPFVPQGALRELPDAAAALSAQPSKPRIVAEHGDVDAALDSAAQRIDADYLWPYQLHASIGPSCAVAEWLDGDANGQQARVWAGTQYPHALRADLARLIELPATVIDVVRLEAAGCYGRNGADDVAADALLLARAVGPGRAVRVQLTREQEHLWEPKGAAQLMRVRGGLDADGRLLAYDFSTSYPSNAAPTLALLLTSRVAPDAQAFEMGDRTSLPPYQYASQRITINDMAPILRASWLRGVSALPNSFAHESHVDELAHAAGVDPVEFRLRHLDDARAAELLRATAERAGWLPHTQPQAQLAQGDWLQGQGVAYARYVHSRFPGFGAAWAAWVADVEVHRQSGEVHVKRVVVGQDSGMVVNPLGVTQQVRGNVLQTTSRAVTESLAIDPESKLPASREWGGYPILRFEQVPVIDVLLMPRQGEPPLGVGESTSVPGTAAIANAIFDATGVRLRQPPFTPEVLRAAMHGAGEGEPAAAAGSAPAPPPAPATRDPQRPRRPWWALGLALATGAVATLAGLLGFRPAIAPLQGSAVELYSTAALQRGRQLAAIGNCVGCHTAPGGAPMAGGRALPTPFGTVYSSNLTPDLEHGIGRWSYPAFERAMREGVARDGRRLYPAFPYTAFALTSDADLQALYAWLMAQPAIAHEPPATRLAFPFNVRPLLGMWNALQPPAVAAPLPGRSAEWQRGAYLVNGLGHCGACHTPRNALGGERSGVAYLGGTVIDGWEAPALGRLSTAAVPWTEAALLQYLKQGHHPRHGIAGGPMAGVVQGLTAADEADLRAMAHYLVSLQASVPGEADAAAQAEAVVARAERQRPLPGAAERLFTGACGACHHAGDGPQLLGLNQPLALNASVRAAQPDNLLRTVLDGIREPAFVDIGHMPAFRDALDDRQIAELAQWMRRRYAPDLPAWGDADELRRRSAQLRGHLRAQIAD